MKMHYHDAGLITMPINGKGTLKNLLSRIQWTNFEETWYEAYDTQTLV